MSQARGKSPLISVVIPAYNHEKFIGPAIDSVLEQTVADFELIVIDDGSPDRTAEVVQSYDDPDCITIIS
jgi:glycosyltransferase involved in cell wall biosynthesis